VEVTCFNNEERIKENFETKLILHHAIVRALGKEQARKPHVTVSNNTANKLMINKTFGKKKIAAGRYQTRR
jgi:hypothetical protein